MKYNEQQVQERVQLEKKNRPARQLRFLLGPPGAGKTQAVLSELIAAAQEYQGWLAIEKPLQAILVPEQQSLAMEYDLGRGLAAVSMCQTARTGILSFSRLARLFNSATSDNMPSDTQLRVLLWQALPRHHLVPSFERLEPVIRELMDQGTSVTELEALATYLEDMAGTKSIRDELAMLTNLYASFIGLCDQARLSAGYSNVSQAAAEAARTTLSGAALWIDGFAEFTAWQWRILDGLLQGGLQSVTCSLLLDGMHSQSEAYQVCLRTKSKFARLAESHGWTVSDEELGTTSEDSQGRQTTTVSCSDRLSETDFAVREIVKLTRPQAQGGQGIQCGSISISVPRLDLYRDQLAARFTDYGLPFFIDERLSLADAPLVQWLRSGLALALEQLLPGLAEMEDIWTVLRSPLQSPAGEAEQIWRLEQYGRERSLKVNAWLTEDAWQPSRTESDALFGSPSRWPEDDIGQLRSARSKLFEPVSRLAAQLRGQQVLSVSDLLEATWACLIEPVVYLAQAAVVKAVASLIKEISAITSNLTLVTPSGSGAHGTEKSEISPGEFLWLLGAATKGLTLGQTPQSQDAIVVADILRGRHDSPEVTFLLGMENDTWPCPLAEEGYFESADRELLATAWAVGTQGAVPWFPLRRRNIELCDLRPYLALVAQTRPRKLLYATRPMNESGEALEPSPYFENLATASGEPTIEYGLTASLSLSRARSHFDLSLARSVVEPKQPARWQPVPQLRRKLADQNGTLNLSPSQLESIGACPAKHFIQFGLRLRPEDDRSFGRRDVGTAYHVVLQQLGSALAGSTDVDPPAFEVFLNRIFDQFLPAFRDRYSKERGPYVEQRLRNFLRKGLVDLHSDKESARYKIEAVEVDLKKNTLGLRPYRFITAAGPVMLGGRIDRIDSTPLGALRITDYKLSSAKFDWNSFFAGTQLQVFLYLLAIATSTGGRTSLQGQLHTVEPQRQGDVFLFETTPVGEAPGRTSQATRSALSDGRLQRWAIDSAARIAHELASWIDDGIVAAEPLRYPGWTACSSCSFRSICRFEPDLNPYRDRPRADLKAIVDCVAGGVSPETPIPTRPERIVLGTETL